MILIQREELYKKFDIFELIFSKIAELTTAIDAIKKKNDSLPSVNPLYVASWCVGSQFYGNFPN